MKRLFALGAMLATACCSYAGQYYLVSMSEVGFSATGNSAVFFGSRNIAGHGISASLHMQQLGPSAFTVQGQLQWVVWVTVLWQEDYPGEPAPSSVDLVWDFGVEGRGGFVRAQPTDSCFVYCTFAPPVFPTPPDYSGTTSWNNLLGTGGPQGVTAVGSGLTFANVGGQWIGTGGITLGLQAGGQSVAGSLSRSFNSDNTIDATLVSTLTGDPIQ